MTRAQKQDPLSRLLEISRRERAAQTTEDSQVTMTDTRPAGTRKIYNTAARRAFIECLEANGGEIRDRSGRATMILMQKSGHVVSGSACSGTLRRMEADGQITRELNGKRTLRIALVGYQRPEPELDQAEVHPDRQPIGPGEMADALRDHVNGTAVVRVDGVGDEPATVERVTPAPVPVVDYNAVAAALLERVMATVDERDVHLLRLDLDAVKARLATTLDDNQRLRRKLVQAGDDLTAMTRERDGLRSRLQSSEDNLQAVLKSGGAIISDQARKAVDRVMRQAPAGSHGRD